MRRVARFALVFALFPILALAQQAKLPEFTIVDLGPMNIDSASQSAPQDPVKAFDNIRNDQMQTVLRLQNQITMINALTNWQAQVTKMEETYNNAGLPFTAPMPPRDICTQVPANSVCGDAYPDLAPVSSRKPVHTQQPDITLVAPDTPAPAETVKKPEPKKPSKEYQWADIRCMANACHAVVVDTGGGARIGAIEGDTIDDGILVQSITPTGVTLRINGVATPLKPSDSPAQNTAASSTAPSSSPAASLQAALSNAPTAAAIPTPSASDQPIVLDDGSGTVPGGGTTAAAPATGGTGLY